MPVTSKVNTRVTLRRHRIDEGQLRILQLLAKHYGAKIEDVLNDLIVDFNKTHLQEYLGEILAQTRDNDEEVNNNSASKINLKTLAQEIGEMSRADFIKAYSGKLPHMPNSKKINSIFTIEESIAFLEHREKNGY